MHEGAGLHGGFLRQDVYSPRAKVDEHPTVVAVKPHHVQRFAGEVRPPLRIGPHHEMQHTVAPVAGPLSVVLPSRYPDVVGTGVVGFLQVDGSRLIGDVPGPTDLPLDARPHAGELHERANRQASVRRTIVGV